MIDLNSIQTTGDFNEEIIKNTLIIGFRGDLMFSTFVEKKGKKNILNSEKSWNNWRDHAIKPVIFKNKFMTGFKLGEVNKRYSNQAKNTDNITLVHPAFNKRFEISLSDFVKLAKSCTITNGVIDIELILTGNNNVYTKKEYEDEIQKLEKKKLEEKEKKNSKVKVKKQIPGCFYEDIKTGKDVMFLGSVDFETKNGIEKRFVYSSMYSSDLRKPFENLSIQNLGNEKYEERIIPSIVSGCDYIEHTKERKLKRTTRPLYNLSVVKFKKTLYYKDSLENTISHYDLYTHEMWLLIYKVYENLDFDIIREPWFKLKDKVLSIKINFKEDYLNTKN